MKQLYLIRHGEVHNPHQVEYRRLPGYHLSEKGRNEVRITASLLARIPLQNIWVSPLERTVETAEIINEYHHIPLVLEERIVEWGDGENPDEVKKRMLDFISDWKISLFDISAIVSHRDPIRELLFALEECDSWPGMQDLNNYPLPTAGVYVAEYDGSRVTISAVLNKK
jgi:broad specificity phosphatase PhoE